MVAHGDHKMAAATYLDLYRHARMRPEWLFQGAAALAQAGDDKRAIGLLVLYLQVAPADAPQRGDAEALRAAAQKRRSDRKVAAKALAENRTLAVAAAARSERTSRTLAYVLVGSGFALAAGGAGLWQVTAADVTAYTADTAPDKSGKTSKVSFEEAQRRAATIRQHHAAELALGGVGVAAIGVGAWLWLRPSDRFAVLPAVHGTGASVAWRF